MRNIETPDDKVNKKQGENDGLSRVIRMLHRVEDVFLMGVFFVMLGMAVLQIVLRSFFSAGIAWGDVLVRICVLWICLLGAMIATRQDNHININVISRYLPDKSQKLLGGVVRVIVTGVCLMMAWVGIGLVRLDFEYGTIAFASVPAWICELIIPIGFFVIAVRYVIISIDYFKRSAKRPV